MRILAFSDLHGDGFLAASDLIDRHHPEWVVCCGDMLPDFNQRPANLRLLAQQEFWRDHRHLLTRQGVVSTLILGNHELPGFRYPGMQSLPEGFSDKVVRLEGIPGDSGPFSFAQGMSEAELEEELKEQLAKVANPQVFLSHAPPYGSRDLTLRGNHIGHRPLFRYLHGREWPHSLIFCGHVHQSFGFEEVGATTILNVATGYALVEWEETQIHVLEMARLVENPNFWDSP